MPRTRARPESAPRSGDVAATEKQRVRERIWARLQHEGATRFPGAQGRIPNFAGAEAAARRLAALPEWRAARVVKANPDAPQLPVRALALEGGKLLVMPVPRLTEERPFVVLDRAPARVSPRRAAAIRAVLEHGRPTRVKDLPHVDLIVCGSVAVNRAGARVGKGGGYSDLEFGLLSEAGLVDDATTIVTTVHPLQLLDRDLPETAHDFRVDLIVTPDEVIRCRRVRRPAGIIWDDLDDEKRAAVPVLGTRERRVRR